MNHTKIIYSLILSMLTFIFSCESFVEIDTPNFQITTEAVFKDVKLQSQLLKVFIINYTITTLDFQMVGKIQ